MAQAIETARATDNRVASSLEFFAPPAQPRLDTISSSPRQLSSPVFLDLRPQSSTPHASTSPIGVDRLLLQTCITGNPNYIKPELIPKTDPALLADSLLDTIENHLKTDETDWPLSRRKRKLKVAKVAEDVFSRLDSASEGNYPYMNEALTLARHDTSVRLKEKNLSIGKWGELDRKLELLNSVHEVMARNAMADFLEITAGIDGIDLPPKELSARVERVQKVLEYVDGHRP